jgi:hypothetical protein
MTYRTINTTISTELAFVVSSVFVCEELWQLS